MNQRDENARAPRRALGFGLACSRPVLAVASVLGALAAAPAGADWIVTRDGDRVETRGEWQVKRQLVVFHLPSGELASLKLADVDLEASREATEAAARPAAAPAAPKEPVKPALVLTDADVDHVRPESAPAGEEEAQEGEEGEGSSGDDAASTTAAEAEAAARLVVTDWGEVDDPQVEGVTITGRLSNSSLDVTAQTSVMVKLYDADGELVASTEARLTSTTLTPGQTANFRAAFPSIFTYETVRFETDSLPLESGAREPAPEADSG